MKYNNIHKFSRKFLTIAGIFLAIGVLLSSCNEEEFLETVPVDFYSPTNSFVTASDYDAALLDLYARVRDNFNQSAGDSEFPPAAIASTDLMYNHKNIGQFKPMSETLLPTNSMVYNVMRSGLQDHFRCQCHH